MLPIQAVIAAPGLRCLVAAGRADISLSGVPLRHTATLRDIPPCWLRLWEFRECLRELIQQITLRPAKGCIHEPRESIERRRVGCNSRVVIGGEQSGVLG